jgi:hypothetical protein
MKFRRAREPDPVVSLLTGTNIFSQALLSEPEPWEMHQSRMIRRAFLEWLEGWDQADKTINWRDALEEAFRAGYDQRASEEE